MIFVRANRICFIRDGILSGAEEVQFVAKGLLQPFDKFKALAMPWLGAFVGAYYRDELCFFNVGVLLKIVVIFSYLFFSRIGKSYATEPRVALLVEPAARRLGP